MTAPTTGTTATLGIDHYAFVLLRQWKIVAAAAVAGALIAGATLLLVPRTYTATTTVLANVITVNPFSQGQSASQLFDYATEASIARSQSVVDLAAPSIPGGREPAEIRDNLEVSTSSDSTVVVIAYTAGSESQARTGADALATSYLDYRSAKAEERIDAAVTNLDDSLADLNDELAGANAALATNAPETQVYIEASSVKDSVTLEIQSLASQRAELVNLDTTGGSLLTSAQSNDVAAAPSRVLLLATGLAAGVAGGVLLAFLRNPFDRRLRTEKEAARAAGVPLLAVVGDGDAAGTARLDALRVVRERVFAETRGGTVSILVVDATQSERLDATVFDLAEVVAQSPRRTLLVAPEMDQAQLDSAASRWALAEPRGAVSEADALPDLKVYVPQQEAASDEPDALFTRDALATLNDIVPGTMAIVAVRVDAHAASVLAAIREANAAVLVSRSGVTRRDVVERIVAELDDMDVPLLGLVSLPRGTAAANAVSGDASGEDTERSRVRLRDESVTSAEIQGEESADPQNGGNGKPFAPQKARQD